MIGVERVLMTGVMEHNEGRDVLLSTAYGTDRRVIRARNEGGHNCTEVDLLDVLKWVAENKPEIYMGFVNKRMIIDYT